MDSCILEWLKRFIQNNKMDDPQKYISFFHDNIGEFHQSDKSELFSIIIFVFFKINKEKNSLVIKEIKLEAQSYHSYNTKTK